MTIDMMQTTFPPELQAFLRSLASETRQTILLLFATKPELTVGQIATAIGISQPTASEHLAILKRAGALYARRDGKEVFYRPNRALLIQHTEQLLAYLTHCCPEE